MKLRNLAASALFAALIAACGAAPASAAGPDFNRMSLAETLDFLQGAVMSQGLVAWEARAHDSNKRQDWTYRRSVESSDFSLDLAGCQFSFHYKVTTDGRVSTEVDGGIPFRLVNAVETMNESQRLRKVDAQAGHPTWSSTTSPEIYVVDVFRNDGQENVLSFYDKGVADQAADAIEHARALCKGS
jgi:hypothetical protein